MVKNSAYLLDMRQQKRNWIIVYDDFTDENDFELQPEIDGVPKFHYVWIKSLPRLVSHQVSKNESKIYICDRCLHFLYYEHKLIIHEEDCTLLNDCRLELAKKSDKILKFKKYKYQNPLQYIMYVDFKCFLTLAFSNDNTTTHKKKMPVPHMPCMVSEVFFCA